MIQRNINYGYIISKNFIRLRGKQVKRNDNRGTKKEINEISFLGNERWQEKVLIVLGL